MDKRAEVKTLRCSECVCTICVLSVVTILSEREDMKTPVPRCPYGYDKKEQWEVL